MLVAAVAVAVLAVACEGGSAQQASAPAPTPTISPTPGPTPSPGERYERIACPFDVPLGRLIECGYLRVPENRNDPQSRHIELAVAVAKSDSPDPRPDPIVYLEGGPGGSILKIAPQAFEGWFSPFVAERDVIMFDQRGIGRSKPALDCPEFNDAYVDAVERGVRRQAFSDLIVGAMASCHERLAAREIDLSAYNSAESAADLQDLRLALGYEQWNLYGISYGTRLGLTAMRDYPQGIRSVILDSSYPPQADLYAELVPNARRAFNELFEGCRQDGACNAAYPDLERVVFEVAARLDAEPADLSVWNPATDKTIEAKMSGDVFLSSLFQALYSTDANAYLPAIVYAAYEGDVEPLTPLLGDLFFVHDSLSTGMHYSVQCREEVPFSSAENVAAAAQADAGLAHALGEPIFVICEDWGVAQPDPKENQPVRSEIPTLVLAGEYDPITPPAWGRLVSDDLTNSFFFEFPNVGHGASVADICPLLMTLAFLDNPTASPDSSCIAEMPPPDFELP
ncbi:MAG: alpha/beta fold hydrolase [Dehalococcoidia bacterium]